MKILKTLLQPDGYLDDCEMVDADLRVIRCGLKSLPGWISDRFYKDDQWTDINDLTFFYHPGADAIVLNLDHPHYDLYELLVIVYMKADEETKTQIRDKIPAESIGDCLDILDFITEERNKQCQTLSTIS